jgi:RHS repeat-associated protein
MLGLAVIALTGASAGSAYAVVPTTTIAIAHTVTSHAVAGVSTGSTAKSAAAHVEMPVPGGASLGVSAYNAVSCLTSTKCVAVGALASGQGQIGTTTNAGTTYSPISLPASTPALRAVSCVANAECAAVGVGDIVTSVDGGMSWTSHQLSDAGLNLMGVDCTSSSLCLAVGMNTQAPRPSSHAEIYRSTDQGSTWTLASVPSQVSGIGAVACPTATRCIAVGSNVLVSNDAGATWTPIGVTGGVSGLVSISCSSATTCVGVGPNPQGEVNHALPAEAIETTDAGGSFHTVKLPPYTASAFEVSCSSSSMCVVSGAEGTGQSAPTFATSSDGGGSWTVGTPPPSFVGVAGISCLSGGNCVLVGSTSSGAATVSLSANQRLGAVKQVPGMTATTHGATPTAATQGTAAPETHTLLHPNTNPTSGYQTLGETLGGTNPIETCGGCESWGTAQDGTATPPDTDPNDLVNTATGDVNESYTLFSAPSLSNDFYQRLSYDSQYAIMYSFDETAYANMHGTTPFAGPYGWGWISNDNSNVLNTTGGSNAEVMVTESTGAQVYFYQEVGGACPTAPAGSPALVPKQYGTVTPIYCAEPDVNADFAEYSNYGLYTIYQNGGLQNTSYNGYGLLQYEGTANNAALMTRTYNVPVGLADCPQNASHQVSSCDVDTDNATGRFDSTAFSAFGLAVYFLDPAGHMWAPGYSSTIGGIANTNNELTTITDPNGHNWGFTYDSTASGGYLYGLTAISDPDAHTTSLGYDHSGTDGHEGLVTSVTDAMTPANTTTYSYAQSCGTCAGASQQTTVTTLVGTQTTGDQETDDYYYLLQVSENDTTNRPTSPYFGHTSTTSFAYNLNALTPVESTTEPNGTYVTDSTSPTGNLLSEEIQPAQSSPTSSTTNYAYNAYNEVCWKALPGVAVSNPAPGCASPPAGSTHNVYDSYGDLFTSTDPLGRTTSYGYNTLDQLCWKTLPDQIPGTSPTCAAPPAAASTYAYNLSNELALSSTPDGTSPSFTRDITTNTYNGYGEVLATVSPDGNVTGANAAAYTTTKTYDTAGRLTAVTSPYTATSTETSSAVLDAVGNAITVTDGAGLVTTNFYDADNRVCWSVQAAAAQTNCYAPPAGSTLYAYRGATSDVIDQVDPDANSTLTAYANPFFPDSASTVTDATGDITSNVYDAGGNLCLTGTATTSLYGSTMPPCTWQNGYTAKAYDQFANVVVIQNPSGAITNNSYLVAAYPNLVSTTTPPAPQAATTYAYDADGELTNTLQGSVNVSASYTATGNLCWRTPTYVAVPSCTSPPANLTTTPGATEYAYNAAELPYVEADVNKAGTAVLGYSSYDPQGQLLSNYNDNAQTVTYTYDPAGDNTCVSYPVPGNTPTCAGAPSATNTVVDYAYDGDGRMTSETPWAGNALSFAYNARSDLTAISGYPALSLASESLSYDAADNLTGETVAGLPLLGAGFTDTFSSNPDELYSNENTGSDTYNPQRQVLQGGADTYTYGTPTANSNGEISSDTPTAKMATYYAYNSAAELTATLNLNTAVTSEFGYDAQGNRCAQVASTTAPTCGAPTAATSTYGYDAYNHLCWSGTGGTTSGEGSCASAPSGATTYQYDGSGLRISDQVGTGATQDFTYDTQTRPGQPVMMMDATNAYIYGPANFGGGTAPLEQIPLVLSSLLPAYLFSDPNGVRSIMTAVGTLIGVATQTYSYNAYGTRTATGLGLLGSTPFGFQGGYTDASSLIYFVNRYYDPATEQWLTVDPDVAATGQPYVFTGGDPVNVYDPLGLNYQLPPLTVREAEIAGHALNALQTGASVVDERMLGPVGKAIVELINFIGGQSGDELLTAAKEAIKAVHSSGRPQASTPEVLVNIITFSVLGVQIPNGYYSAEGVSVKSKPKKKKKK